MPRLSEVAGNDLREKLETIFTSGRTGPCFILLKFEADGKREGYMADITIGLYARRSSESLIVQRTYSGDVRRKELEQLKAAARPHASLMHMDNHTAAYAVNTWIKAAEDVGVDVVSIEYDGEYYFPSL